jgi:8-oxo-dGTP diphosphatase
MPMFHEHTVDAVLLTEDGQILLIERKDYPYAGYLAFPGGYVDAGESPLQAVLRELAEETDIHLRPDDMRKIGYYDTPGRDPRGPVATTVYVATLSEPVTPTAGDDARNASWVPLKKRPSLAFDHADILTDVLAAEEVYQTLSAAHFPLARFDDTGKVATAGFLHSPGLPGSGTVRVGHRCPFPSALNDWTFPEIAEEERARVADYAELLRECGWTVKDLTVEPGRPRLLVSKDRQQPASSEAAS